MTIPVEIVWGIVIALLGFILGTLWGHHGEIIKRVTHEECLRSRHDCPCFKDIEELKDKLDKE